MNQTTTPMPLHIEQSQVSQADFAHLIASQISDGMDPAIVLTGLTTAAADFLHRNYGAARAIRWFYAQFCQATNAFKAEAARDARAAEKGGCA